jgi:hypothetical protein
MKRRCRVVVLVLVASSTLAATTKKFTAGWDKFNEPLDYKKSGVTWSVNPTKHTLAVTYKLTGAPPSQLLPVAIHIFCSTSPATFGQFAVFQGAGPCQSETRQGVTRTGVDVFLGVPITDINGDTSFALTIGPIAAGSYDVEFDVFDSSFCSTGVVDFQSPGPTFGDTTTITIP